MPTIASTEDTPAAPFKLDDFKRVLSNTPEVAGDWLSAHLPDPDVFSVWRATATDELPTIGFIRSNRINGYLSDVSKTNQVFGIFRDQAGSLEGLFLVKSKDLGPLEGTSIQECFTLHQEGIETMIEAVVTHVEGTGVDFEDYILK